VGDQFSFFINKREKLKGKVRRGTGKPRGLVVGKGRISKRRFLCGAVCNEGEKKTEKAQNSRGAKEKLPRSWMKGKC